VLFDLVKDAETAFGMSCVLSTPRSVDSIDRNRPLQLCGGFFPLLRLYHQSNLDYKYMYVDNRG
jgi:hypothetical protein